MHVFQQPHLDPDTYIRSGHISTQPDKRFRAYSYTAKLHGIISLLLFCLFATKTFDQTFRLVLFAKSRLFRWFNFCVQNKCFKNFVEILQMILKEVNLIELLIVRLKLNEKVWLQMSEALDKNMGSFIDS